MTPLLQQLAGFTRFAQPLWLAAGLAAAVLLPVSYLLHDRRQRRALAAFAVERAGDDWGLGVSRGLLWLRRGCLTAAALCGFVALAQPLGAPQVRTEQDRGIDLLLAIDTSRSMLTQDIRPDRLTRARLAVMDLLDQLGGDAVGLVAFAGDAFLMAPLTTDHEAFRETLEALDTHTIPVGGTDIAAAIRLAQSTLASHHDADPVVVLVTDGEDLDGGAVKAAQAAGKAGIRIYTVGVGTAAGDLIPVPDGAGGEHFVRDPEGNLVKSRLDEATLRQIAQATGGSYQPLGAQGQGIAQLYQRTLSRLGRHAIAGRQVEVHAQLFQWPLAMAVLLLLIEWLVRPVRRYRPVIAAAAMLLAGLPLWFAPLQRAEASPAEQQYRDGAQAYRGKDYDAAVKAYRDALQTTDVQLQQNAYYDLGNALYRQGSAAGRDPQQAMRNFQQALSAYDAALQLRPSDADARFNRGVVQQKLKQLQQQQRRQQGGSRQGDNGQQRNQSGQQSQSGQQGQQNQQGQPQADGQQRNGQSGSGQNPQPQQNPAPGSQPRQPDANAANPPQAPGSKGSQPQPQQGGNTQPQPRQPAPGQPQPATGTAQAQQGKARGSGEMTREEAEQLLDSLRGQEHRLLAGGSDDKTTRQAAPLRDW